MRLVVLGDLHLHAGSDRAVTRDFAALVDRGLADGPFRLVLSGDVYDLALAGSGPVADRLAAIDAWHVGFHDALARLCSGGGEVIFVPGNHDAELASAAAREYLERRVPGARVSEWFHREPGVVHVEHGHQYDPDNALAHPLVWERDSLGVMLTRKVLSGLGDLRLLRSSQATPLPVLLHCLIGYGIRTPALIARYTWLGLRALVRRADLTAAWATGRQRAAALALQRDLPEEELHRVAGLSAPSVLGSRRSTFRRLYLDRLFASYLFVGGALAATLGLLRLSSAAAVAIVATAIVVATLLSPNRYAGLVHERLRKAAHRIATETGTACVVFGHAHGLEEDGAYFNTGSFGLPGRGAPRSWVEIVDGVAHHRTMPAGE